MKPPILPPPPRQYFASEYAWRQAVQEYEDRVKARVKSDKDEMAAIIVLVVVLYAIAAVSSLFVAWLLAGVQGVLILIASCGLLWVAWVQVRQRL